MIRKIKRNILKKELGTNNISDAYHERYGYKPNITKQELKLKDRLKKALMKAIYKKSRLKKRKKEK